MNGNQEVPMCARSFACTHAGMRQITFGSFTVLIYRDTAFNINNNSNNYKISHTLKKHKNTVA